MDAQKDTFWVVSGRFAQRSTARLTDPLVGSGRFAPLLDRRAFRCLAPERFNIGSRP